MNRELLLLYRLALLLYKRGNYKDSFLSCAEALAIMIRNHSVSNQEYRRILLLEKLILFEEIDMVSQALALDALQLTRKAMDSRIWERI